MATCEKIEQTPVPPPPVYRLDLTEREAQYICALLTLTSIEDDDDLAEMEVRLHGVLCDALKCRTRRIRLTDGCAIYVEGWDE